MISPPFSTGFGAEPGIEFLVVMEGSGARITALDHEHGRFVSGNIDRSTMNWVVRQLADHLDRIETYERQGKE